MQIDEFNSYRARSYSSEIYAEAIKMYVPYFKWLRKKKKGPIMCGMWVGGRERINDKAKEVK